MKNFIKRIKERNKYSTNKRFVFYDLAGGYLPKSKDPVVVSNKYKIKDLVYRYTKDLDDFEWGSEYIFINVLIKIIRKTLSVLGFHKYTKNGYTLILEKHYG